LRECRNIIAESGAIGLVNDDRDESGRHSVRVLLELRLDVDGERGSHGGEQTSLDPYAGNIKNTQILAWCSGLRRVS